MPKAELAFFRLARNGELSCFRMELADEYSNMLGDLSDPANIRNRGFFKSLLSSTSVIVRHSKT